MSKLWGGRFAAATDSLMEEFGRSLESDSILAPYDLKVCWAHVTMLGESGAIDASLSQQLAETISQVQTELQNGQLPIEGDFEDVHSWVESVLSKRCGPNASLIRLGRSRNDLVVTDFRLWMLDAIAQTSKSLRELQTALLSRAEENVETILPGYTHLQRAQPISLGHHLLAHFWSLERDIKRLENCREMADCCTLGAGALAGSSWPINPQRTAELLGFSGSFDNSLDAVSDRDFAADFLHAASLSMMHLSRMAEELILWSTPEFGFAVFDDAWSTGSSLMPQKKNPDPAELVRGKAGRMLGYHTGFMAMLKSLPMAYNRDLQEDKPPVFEAARSWDMCLRVFSGVYRTLTFKPDGMASACSDPGLLATDLADALVRSGLPFSEAHELSGKWVRHALSDAEMKITEPHVGQLSAKSVLEARQHRGSAGPQSVKEQIIKARKLLESTV